VDEEWEVRKERLMFEITQEIKKFKSDDPASKAVFILGRVQASFREMDAPRLIVAEYETSRKRYVERCAAEGTKPVTI
jgi:hypothetical protein